MKTIHKYPVEIQDLFELQIPAGAKILTAFVQNGSPYLWAEVDTSKPLQKEVFAILGTGNLVPTWIREKTYIATFPMPPYVWHLYKVILK